METRLRRRGDKPRSIEDYCQWLMHHKTAWGDLRDFELYDFDAERALASAVACGGILRADCEGGNHALPWETLVPSRETHQPSDFDRRAAKAWEARMAEVRHAQEERKRLAEEAESRAAAINRKMASEKRAAEAAAAKKIREAKMAERVAAIKAAQKAAADQWLENQKGISLFELDDPDPLPFEEDDFPPYTTPTPHELSVFVAQRLYPETEMPWLAAKGYSAQEGKPAEGFETLRGAWLRFCAAPSQKSHFWACCYIKNRALCDFRLRKKNEDYRE